MSASTNTCRQSGYADRWSSCRAVYRAVYRAVSRTRSPHRGAKHFLRSGCSGGTGGIGAKYPALKTPDALGPENIRRQGILVLNGGDRRGSNPRPPGPQSGERCFPGKLWPQRPCAIMVPPERHFKNMALGHGVQKEVTPNPAEWLWRVRLMTHPAPGAMAGAHAAAETTGGDAASRLPPTHGFPLHA
jgi:hypothetical protein